MDQNKLTFAKYTDIMMVLWEGKSIGLIPKEFWGNLLDSKNESQFAYRFEKNFDRNFESVDWVLVFDDFKRIVNLGGANVTPAFIREKLDEKKNLGEGLKEQEERIVQDMERQEKIAQEIERQKKIEREREGLEAAPLTKALKAQALMREQEDQMFYQTADALGLPAGMLVIDPSMLHLLRLNQVSTDQEIPIDREYRKKYFLTILRIFDSNCANCKSRDNGIHLDHFMVPRSKGGTFIINTKTGISIHNAIPLCEPCNIQKSNKDYRHFFPADVLRDIFLNLAKMPPAYEFDFKD